MEKINPIVIDTWAWIEYFSGTEEGKIVAKYLSEHECYTPSIVLGEIAGKYFRENFPSSEVRKRLLFIMKMSNIINLDVELAIEGGLCWVELRNLAKTKNLSKKPSLSDGIILAATRKINGRVITGDPHFKFLKEAIFLGAKNS